MKPITALGITASLIGVAASQTQAASVDAAPGFFFATLPFSDTGTTIGAVNDINTLPGGVSNFTTVAGPDVFYTFNVVTPGTMTFTLTPTGQTGYDPAIYLLTGGTTGTSAMANNGRDAAGFNGTESLTTSALAPLAPPFTTVPLPVGTYFFVIDSFYNSGSGSAGAYRLEVTGTALLGPNVPEPGTAALGLTALAATSWRRRRQGAR